MDNLNHLVKKFSIPDKSLCGKNSFLVGLEGIEGAGKSTQALKLQQYWSSNANGCGCDCSSNCDCGYQVFLHREPGGTALGESLRAAILGYKGEELAPLAPLAQAFIFAAARAQLLTEKVLPELKKDNTIVILDRYIYSSIAYQGVAGGLGPETILKIHDHYPLSFLPHITFYYKISPELSVQRQHKRQILSQTKNERDYFERQALDFFYKIKEGMDL